MKKNGSGTSQVAIRLESVRIQNYRSLRDVTLRLKPLTIIVGPNASGKSNILEALRLMNKMLVVPEPPPNRFIKENLWLNGGREISFELRFHIGQQYANYQLSVGPAKGKTPYKREVLEVDNVRVIDVTYGKGSVKNEDGSQTLPFGSSDLAIKSAGSYGEKPVTNALADFVRAWEFYDVDPDRIRQGRMPMVHSESRLDPRGGALNDRITKWAAENPLFLEEINDGMKACGGAEFEIAPRKHELRIKEGLDKSLPLDAASDGTLRLLFYYTLPHQPDLPSLIGIEEPERNLHPGVFTRLSYLLDLLSQKSQVVLTTHSSQLLDCFSPEDLNKNLAVILLNKREREGTQAISLESIQHDREAVRDWMSDFGIGNAVFQSQLLQDIIEA